MVDISLDGFEAPIRAIIFGASGGIGAAFYKLLSAQPAVAVCLGTRHLSSHDPGLAVLDLRCEADIERCAADWAAQGPFHLIINATGLLHSTSIQPEKRMRDLSADHLAQQFMINAIGPALLMKHFLPLLEKRGKTVFAHLSARVGSISDNKIGGWYGYRAAKAAQNMLTRTASIEWSRRNGEAIIIGLHPGTVDTALSQPFQGAVPEGQIVSPEHAAQNLLAVLNTLSPAQSGQLIAWDGRPIPF